MHTKHVFVQESHLSFQSHHVPIALTASPSSILEVVFNVTTFLLTSVLVSKRPACHAFMPSPPYIFSTWVQYFTYDDAVDDATVWPIQ